MIEGWLTEPEAAWLKEQAQKAKIIVEIGCWLGKSTKVLCQSPALVYSVDHFQGNVRCKMTKIPNREAHIDQVYKNLHEELESCQLTMLIMSSLDAANRMSGIPLDMVWIDGSHDAASVTQDIEVWRPLLAPGGLLCGHDRHVPGVRKAIKKQLFGWLPGPGSIWYVR